MKIPINLASQPFRRDRALLIASIAVSLLLVGTLGGLISLILLDRSQLADVRHDVNQLDKEIQRVTAQQAGFDAVLRRPENTEVIERSVMLNELLYRKGISWTRILSDLEKTMPFNVRLMSVRPYVNKENQVTLDMQVGAETQGAVIEFLKALESSQLFESPTAPSSQAPSQSEPLFRSRVVVNYAQRL
ncbi:MAG TPA: PilN domain-containing protein [Bryobacteraceae bacterium]|jgi:type IV pilus assembly protein PilN|nr:PilN domain-containing protein [Bryobacteraceae bacterium]